MGECKGLKQSIKEQVQELKRFVQRSKGSGMR